MEAQSFLSLISEHHVSLYLTWSIFPIPNFCLCFFTDQSSSKPYDPFPGWLAGAEPRTVSYQVWFLQLWAPSRPRGFDQENMKAGGGETLRGATGGECKGGAQLELFHLLCLVYCVLCVENLKICISVLFYRHGTTRTIFCEYRDGSGSKFLQSVQPSIPVQFICCLLKTR